MYSLVIAHTNDFLRQEEIIGAVASIGMLVALGSICGPILVSVFMNMFGPDGYFVYLFVVHGLIGLFGLYRMTKRSKPTDLESQYVPLPRNISTAGIELSPIAEPLED